MRELKSVFLPAVLAVLAMLLCTCSKNNSPTASNPPASNILRDTLMRGFDGDDSLSDTPPAYQNIIVGFPTQNILPFDSVEFTLGYSSFGIYQRAFDLYQYLDPDTPVLIWSDTLIQGTRSMHLKLKPLQYIKPDSTACELRVRFTGVVPQQNPQPDSTYIYNFSLVGWKKK